MKLHVTRLHESKYHNNQYYHDISLAITVTALNSVSTKSKCFTQLNVYE